MTALAPTSTLIATTQVAVGGAVGAAARYQLGRGLTAWLGPQAMTAFPWATLAANVLGGLAMGVLAGWLMQRSGSAAGAASDSWRLLIGVGLLGGFTTFSSFSLETMLLIERGQAWTAMTYVLVSVLACLAALYIGLIATRLAA